jgi:hypothetical protein
MYFNDVVDAIYEYHALCHKAYKAYCNKQRKKTTWINVKDKLPETGANVLVYTELKNTFVASRVCAEIWEDDYGVFLAEGVTHWRSLPKPPESEE